MRRLTSQIGEIPRGFADHRSAFGVQYRRYCSAIQRAHGPLPDIALPILQEAGRAHVELGRLNEDLEHARAARNRQRQARAIRKQIFMAREQLTRLERRIEELTARPGRRRTPMDTIRDAPEVS